MNETNTKNRILDAAEKLFTANGLTGTSLRAIIKEAEVNTAAVHYHFGSKEALVEAVLHRRVAPFNDDRIALLDRVEEQYPNGTLPLEEVIEAFLVPVIRTHADRPHPAELFPLLLGRAILEPDKKVEKFLPRIFGKIFERFSAAFSRALPDLSPEEIRWRIHFMIGALVFTVVIPRVHAGTEQETRDNDQSLLTKRLVGFVAAGMRSPVSAKERKDHR